ncbi:MAG: helicase [Gammaproteobacteria bacterium]|nr:MAG: helicase [Gammaproteobacteria bacterium]
MTDVTKLFQQGGGLSDTLSHFELRDGQVKLVEAIDEAITHSDYLIAEAGTGIGKTFAYLLPTLARHKQVFVSTATKHLQEQIFFKDLPIIEKVLGRSVRACLLKGRSNYICKYRFKELYTSAQLLSSKRHIRKLNQINDWLTKTRTGDLSEIAEFAGDDIGLLNRICSNVDRCQSKHCGCVDDCFVQKAREKAKKSDVVIVNHALLMADIVLKETGFAEILPDVDVVVIDEAHHLPKIATQAFAEQIGSGQLKELIRDALHLYRRDIGDDPPFEVAADNLSAAVSDFLDALQSYQLEGQIHLRGLRQIEPAYQAFKGLMQTFKIFLDGLEALSVRSSDLEQVYERAKLIAARIRTVFVVKFSDDEESKNDSVAVLDWRRDYFSASRLPIYLGRRFLDIMSLYADSWLFVSATLAIGDSFDFFKQSLGLTEDIGTLRVDSPFDYQKQAVIHIAEQLPTPGHPSFVERFVDMSLPILEKTQGRAFILFTSYRNLYEAAELMQDSDFNLLVQGDLPKAQLIDEFIRQDNSVLLGTVSFWEGVDVVGENLSCVIIDKIPFPSPADPIIAEQARYWERQGENAFAACYIPRAATLLKQGTGRLIRSAADKGILVIGDHRMYSKSYGRQLIAAMPPARLVNRKELFEFIDNTL